MEAIFKDLEPIMVNIWRTYFFFGLGTGFIFGCAFAAFAFLLT